MTLPASGPLALTDIQTEFGGTNPIALGEYYAGGGLVPAGTSGTYGTVPSSGALSVQNFYGTTAFTPVYIEEVFSTYLYTGNSSTQTITNGIDLSTKGGLVWVKRRNAEVGHNFYDTARGRQWRLDSSDTVAQTGPSSAGNDLASFNTTGFSLGPEQYANMNDGGGYPYVSWTFREQPKFFDVVTYTGNDTAGRTIAHSLGSVPGCIIVKCYSASGDNWIVYHRSLGATQGLFLNSTGSAITSANLWNNTEPTNTVFSVGGVSGTNGAGRTYVAYLFAHDAGGFGLTGTDNVISCGSFTTSGTSDPNATVNLGYEPQWLMFKKTNVSTGITANWTVVDNMRGWPAGQNNGSGTSQVLQANTSSSEFPFAVAHPTATGFTMDTGNTAETYIYIAIRRGPMKVPTLGTTVYGAVARSGTGASATITSLSFPPDLLIDKARNAGYEPSWWDRLRGPNRVLLSSAVNQETATTDSLNAFGQTGVSIGADSGGYINNSGATYINWFFRRAPSFFDEVCYTGTGSALSVSHNLGIAPELIIAKKRSGAGGEWVVSANALPYTSFLFLESTAAKSTFTMFNPVTASAFTVQPGGVADSGANYVAYLFATCAGVSKVGTYTGTGALQTVNCGFTTGARWVMIKRTDSTGGWYVYDSTRGISSGNDPYLFMNDTANEVTGTNYVDTTSVGFQVTAAAPAGLNASGGTYIFLAIA